MGGVATFSPVKADIDLTMLEFVRIFETDSTLINSQIRKKTYFCQAMNLFFFFGLISIVTWNYSSKWEAFGRQTP